MAVTSSASTVWSGSLTEGSGATTLGTGTSFDVDWKSRSETGGAVTPEELIAAAHASCFSMAFSNELNSNGTPPEKLEVTAKVGFDPAAGGITGSALTVVGTVPGIDEATFQTIAEAAKAGCPVSKALAGIEITLESATLAQ